MRTKVCQVQMTIMRESLNIEMPMKKFVDGKLSEYCSPPEIFILSKEIRQRLAEFDKKVLKDYRNSSLCSVWERENDQDYSYSFVDDKEYITTRIMDPSKLNEFQSRFKEYQNEYNVIKNEIITQYDELVRSFKDTYSQAFGNLKSIEKKIPTKDEYANSFILEFESMGLELLDESDNPNNKRIIGFMRG